MDSFTNKAKEKIDLVNEDMNLSSTVDDRKTEQGVTLPPMPDPPPSFEIQVKAELACDFARYSTGKLSMKQQVAEVTVGGKEIGRIDFGYDACAIVSIGRRTYRVKFEDIFNAVYEQSNRNETY